MAGENHFLRVGALALGLLPFVWASQGNATMVILDFEEPSFSVGSSTSSAPPDDPPFSSQPNYNTPSHTSHGRVITSSKGVGITARNQGNSGFAVVFDSRRTNTVDPDLEDSFGGPNNPGGGISAPDGNPVDGNIRPDHILIVQNDNSYGPGGDCAGGTFCDSPGDESSGPNELEFDFASTYSDGVELKEIDIYDIDEGYYHYHPENVMLTLNYTDGSGSQMTTISGNDIGNNNGARLDLAQLFSKTTNVGTLVVKLKGSGAVDRLAFHAPDPPGGGGTIPEPASIALLLTGVAGLGLIQRRRRKT